MTIETDAIAALEAKVAQLQDDLDKSHAEIRRLRSELQVASHRSWASEACGDDLWEETNPDLT